MKDGLFGIGCVLLVVVCGCSPEASFRLNSVHMLTIEKTMMGDDESITPQQKLELGNLLTAMFGTPDEPWFPDFIPADEPESQVVSLERLSVAAGPVASDRQGEPRGLYREHCAYCHGISGDGTGPTAAFLNPYPRDFRMGKFKFKSTKIGQPPTDADLKRVLQNGIPGTAMPSFNLLPEEHLDALVNYVKYLSIRGQTERRLIEELPNLDNQPLVAAKGSVDDSEFQEQLAIMLEDSFLEIISRWAKFNRPTPVPDVPRLFVDSRLTYAINGRELFYGKANCVQCHGATGLGDGQTENYDDWTNEWLKRANVDLNNVGELAEFVSAGAFPPRKIRPRNLRHRIFRGGSRPQDVFRRIANGIDGTSMPATPTLSTEEIWSLVAFVLELPYREFAEH